MQFRLSCLGYCVGLGNVWRFPYLCYKFGGAAFLLTYLFLQLTIGKPLWFMEVSLGQYSGKGPVRAYDFNPAARGIGLSMCMASGMVSLYYNVIMAYVLLYFGSSFKSTLPWDFCRPEWGPTCITDRRRASLVKACTFLTAPNVTLKCLCTGNTTVDDLYKTCYKPFETSSRLYFNIEVIQPSANITEFGTPPLALSLLLLLSWVIVTLCMIKGIKSSGKVVYFTATFPYVVLFILLIRGATLDGALEGVRYFIIPKWDQLLKFEMWIAAAGQMFFSLSLSMGGIVMYGSYNKFHHPVYRDALIISTGDMLTSMLAGFVIFTTLSHMAKVTGSTIDEVTDSGFGLAFVAYPETMLTLPWSNFWSVLFFFMLYTLGLDSQFALLETASTYLIDDFVWCRRRKVPLRIGMALILYLLGLSLICPGGQYLVGIMDTFAGTYPLNTICLLETVSVMWVYGAKRFLNDLEFMLGKKPRFLPYWYFVWIFWSPICLSVLCALQFYQVETSKYGDGTPYGPGMIFFCWSVYAVVLLPIPLWFFLHLRATVRRHEYTTFKELALKLVEPLERWGPADGMYATAPARQTSVWADVLDWNVFKRLPPPGLAVQPPGQVAVRLSLNKLGHPSTCAATSDTPLSSIDESASRERAPPNSEVAPPDSEVAPPDSEVAPSDSEVAPPVSEVASPDSELTRFNSEGAESAYTTSEATSSEPTPDTGEGYPRHGTQPSSHIL
ncbi:sodium-dependent proline transporter-like isoform X2 [Littorina saxatilis]